MRGLGCSHRAWKNGREHMYIWDDPTRQKKNEKDINSKTRPHFDKLRTGMISGSEMPCTS